MNSTLYSLVGLAAGVAFILALKGLSHPKTARRGNLIGAFGATVATLSVFLYVTPAKGEEVGHALPLHNFWWIIGAILLGLVIGVPAARKVEMTQMPQLVALLTVSAVAQLPSLQSLNISTLVQRRRLLKLSSLYLPLLLAVFHLAVRSSPL